MKNVVITLLVAVLSVSLFTGCGKKRARLNAGNVEPIAVLTLDGNLSDQTPDQVAELNRVITWMDRDIIKQLKASGFNAVLIKDKKEYKKSMGNLLVVDVDNFNAGNVALRAFVGFGAGASSLDLDYKLYNQQGKIIDQWKDGVGSSKGGTYCAQTLNLNAQTRLVGYFNK